MARVAVLDKDRCKPKRCGRLCHRFCPPVRNKIEAIRFENNMPFIVETLCVGCGICVCFCPVDALDGWGIIEINREKCTDCLDCVETCPVDALEVKE